MPIRLRGKIFPKNSLAQVICPHPCALLRHSMPLVLSAPVYGIGN
jgi:hypothetical protein